MLVLKWIWDNKEWLFSGCGIAFVGFVWWLIQRIRNRRRPKPQPVDTHESPPIVKSSPLAKWAVALGLLVLIIGAAGTLGLPGWIVGLFSNSSQFRQDGTLLIATASVKYGEVPIEPGGMRAGFFPEEGFSFASGRAISPDMADFFIRAPGEAPPGGIHAGGVSRLEFEMKREGGRICLLGPIDFDALTEAPDPKKQSDYSRSGVPVKPGEVYCFCIDDGRFWGKLKAVECDGTPSRGTMKFRYVLQQNGTRKFSPPQASK